MSLAESKGAGWKGQARRVTIEQKIERLRGALAAFVEGQRMHDDALVVLRARFNVMKGALIVVLQKLARSSLDPERFVMDIEKLMAIVRDELASREAGAVADAYRAEIKEMFATLRKAAVPTGQRTEKRH